MPSSIRSAAPAVILLAAFALAGCTFSAGPTISPETVADLAATTLEREVGQRPEMDCGDKQIAFAAGTEVVCLLTDPSTGTQYDATVTLESVEGTDELGTSVKVADTPRN